MPALSFAPISSDGPKLQRQCNVIDQQILVRLCRQQRCMLELAACSASLTAQRAQRHYTKLYQLHLGFDTYDCHL